MSTEIAMATFGVRRALAPQGADGRILAIAEVRFQLASVVAAHQL
jgi:hypothetical protein